MTINSLLWLQQWYIEQCDGDWEHTYGIKIDTLDNPGWSIAIDLVQTNLEEESFKKVNIERNEDDWIQICIEDGIFKGCGGPGNLDEILNIFRDWVNRITNNE